MRSTVLVLLLILFVYFFPYPAAAAPQASVVLSANKRFAYLSFSDLRSISRVSYILIYDTSRGQKGIEGGFKVKPRSIRSARRQILGTCSSGKCVYHQGVSNVQLEVTFTSRSGQTTTITRSLP